ncbi:peroxisomal N(1)-acetyl-spermine/spermidine oxidase [Zeugodacus cucurbitae]|nr:peroxisomal N(1)-acetyl-spermine/spermidine oxidase [Zeugodacus cucurbitae]
MTHIRLCTRQLAHFQRTRIVCPTLSPTFVSAISTTISTLSWLSTTAGGNYYKDQMSSSIVSRSASAEFIRRVCKVLCCNKTLAQCTTNKNRIAYKEIISYRLSETNRNKNKTHNASNNLQSLWQQKEAMSTTTTTKTNKVKSMKSARIVIIGAGSAGIAAATRLLQSGFENVFLLEAENRYGGRVHSIPFADNVVDLGAQWCHGEKGNVIFDTVRDLDMLQSTGDIYDDYKCVRSNKEVLSETVANTLKSVAFNLIPARQEGLKSFEGSLGTYLTEAFWRDLQQSPEIDKTVACEFFENYKKFESSVEASDHLFEVSGKGHLEYWLCEGDLLLNWKDKGFRSFLRLLMKAKQNEAPDDMGLLNKRIQFNARVQNIEWQTSSGDVRIRLWNGELIEADHVICTVSLGVLKETHKDMFTPALPSAKCRAIDGLKLGTVDKFFLEFKEPFAPLDWSGFCFLWRDEDLAELRNSKHFWLESVFGFYRVSCQPRILQGWIIGSHARHMETLSEAGVLKALLWLFKKFFTFEVPPPLRFLRTRWYTNPNFRGSYTFRTLYADELRTGGWDLAAPLTADTDGKPLLQFAGEATHTHFYSTVHGAVESGWREAQRLITYYLGHTSQL